MDGARERERERERERDGPVDAKRNKRKGECISHDIGQEGAKKRHNVVVVVVAVTSE